MTPVDDCVNSRRIWGEVLTDTMGIDQRNTAYCESTICCGPGFMGYTSCMRITALIPLWS